MKHTLSVLLLLLLALPAISRRLPMDDDDKVNFSKTIDVPERSADEISLYAASFAKKNNMQEITIMDDTAGKLVKAKISWPYNGGKKSCIGNMAIEGELIVVCRNHEATLNITNFTYRHYSAHSGTIKRIRVDRSREACDSTGTIEMLMDCPQCKGSQRRIYKMIKKNAKEYMSDYKDRMKDPEGEKVNW